MPGGGVYNRFRPYLLYVRLHPLTTVRKKLDGNSPGVLEDAIICDRSGCDGISIDLRGDPEKIDENEILSIKEQIRGRLNLEISLGDRLIDVSLRSKPNKITIFPEGEEKELFCGYDLSGDSKKAKDLIRQYHDQKILVSICIKPVIGLIDLSKDCAADFIQIDTGSYSNAIDEKEKSNELSKIFEASEHAGKIGLKVSAGNGLNYDNIQAVLNARALEEVNIGQTIFSRAGAVGLPKAVQEMLDILE